MFLCYMFIVIILVYIGSSKNRKELYFILLSFEFLNENKSVVLFLFLCLF